LVGVSSGLTNIGVRALKLGRLAIPSHGTGVLPRADPSDRGRHVEEDVRIPVVREPRNSTEEHDLATALGVELIHVARIGLGEIGREGHATPRRQIVLNADRERLSVDRMQNSRGVSKVLSISGVYVGGGLIIPGLGSVAKLAPPPAFTSGPFLKRRRPTAAARCHRFLEW
jgi:hypothetical protein